MHWTYHFGDDLLRNMQNMVSNLLPYDGEAYLFENALENVSFEQLDGEIAWRQDSITLYGKTHPLPRLQAWYADAGLTYTYSRITLKPNPWTPLLLHIKAQVERLSGATFNSVLCNLYRDGKDKNGWHRDDEPELGVNPIIASLSFGETRKFSLRHLKTKERIDLLLPDQSLLVMRGECQHTWEHQLAKTAKVIGAWINLTFRQRK